MKRMVSEKRTQVYFPDEVYRKIQKHARAEDKSSAQVIREAVEKYLEEKTGEVDWDNDPLLLSVGLVEDGPGDLSANHDDYLYGGKRRGRRK